MIKKHFKKVKDLYKKESEKFKEYIKPKRRPSKSTKFTKRLSNFKRALDKNILNR